MHTTLHQLMSRIINHHFRLFIVTLFLGFVFLVLNSFTPFKNNPVHILTYQNDSCIQKSTEFPIILEFKIDSDKTAYEVKNICIKNGFIYFLNEPGKHHKKTEQMYGFNVTFMDKTLRYCTYLDNHVPLFLNVNLIIQNLYHFFKDFALIVYQLVTSRNLEKCKTMR